MNFINNSQINEIHIELSSACRLNCLHCSSAQMIAEKKNGYDLNALAEFLRAFKGDNRHIYVTGGEPLLSPDIYSFIATCKAQNYKVGLFTTFNTGNRTEDVLQNLKDAGTDDFYVSLYDCEEDKHDFVTGVNGSFAVSRGAVAKAKNYGIAAKINFVLLKTNIQRLEHILKEFDKFGAEEIRILKLVNHGNAVNNSDKIGLSLTEQRQAVEKIHNIREQFKTRLTFSGFPALAPCRPFDGKFACGANNTLLYVDCNGDIYPCASQKNIPERKIGTIYDPEHIRKLDCGGECFSDITLK